MKIMKKILMMAAILICGLVMAGCSSSSDDDTTTNEMHAKIANTRWQMTEVLNQNNEWVDPAFYTGVDIRELSFGSDNKYFMRICKSADMQNVTLINGYYDVGRDAINMTDDCYQGIAYNLKITNLSGNTLEGLFTDWGVEQQAYASNGTTSNNVRHYTIRLKRIEK